MHGSDCNGLNSQKTISIVIPTLNEEKGIAKVLHEIPREELENMGYECEIIIVDGGSRDRTREVACKNGAKVVLETRLGYGRAYKTGFSYACGDVLATLDGDFSYPASLIPKLVNLLEEQKLDFISTNRMKNRARESFPAFHIIGNRVLTSFTKLLFRINLEDSQSGMWVFRKDMLDKVNPAADGMAFSEEIKVLAFNFFRTVEVAVPYRKRLGKQKLRTILDGARNLLYLFVLRLSFVSFSPLTSSILAYLDIIRRINLPTKPSRSSILHSCVFTRNTVV